MWIDKNTLTTFVVYDRDRYTRDSIRTVHPTEAAARAEAAKNAQLGVATLQNFLDRLLVAQRRELVTA